MKLSQFGSTTIEAEHLLIGLVREDKDLFSHFVPGFPSRDAIRTQIANRVTYPKPCLQASIFLFPTSVSGFLLTPPRSRSA